MVKKRKATSSASPRRFILPTILLASLVSVIILFGYVKILENRITSLDNVHIQNVLIQHLDDITQPVATEPRTGEVFFHEAHVYLPPAPNDLRLEYGVNSDDPLTIELIDPSSYKDAVSGVENAQDMEGTFEKLPKLQACSRAYKLVFGKQDEENFSLKGSVALADGRSVSIYLNDKCDANAKTFVPYLKQLRSY